MKGFLTGLKHLALIALIVRALIPGGWMPDAHGEMVICSATLGVIHHDGHRQNDQKTSHDECPFAGAQHLAFAPDLPVLNLPSLHSFAATADRDYVAVIAAHFTPGSPRAPPAFA